MSTQPTISWHPRRRKAELAEEIRSLQAKIEDVNKRIAEFRGKNFVMVNGNVMMRADRITAVPAIENGLRELIQERDLLLGKWHLTLSENASLKGVEND